MMSDKNEELDLRLALGYSDKNNGSKLKNNKSGAGVNAGRGVDMTFGASDPLSELVWSPHKGLSVKCTGSGLADKKPFLLWNVGPSNATHSPSESLIFEVIDEGKDIGKGKLLVTEAMSQLDMEDAQRLLLKNVLAPSSGDGDGKEKLNTGEGFEIAEPLSKRRKKDLSAPQHIQITERDENNEGSGERQTPESLQQVAEEDNASGTQTLGLGLTQQESNEKAAMIVEEESGGKRAPLEKLDSSAENYKQNLITKEASGRNEKRVMRINSLPIETSQTYSKTSSRRRKGKEKAFSDGNANSRMSSNEEDSHESVDSCNSARMLPQGKRQWHFEQPLFVGSKRVRRQMQGHVASTSSVGNDSSFMTWISNMVNGFSKTNVEEAPLPLSLAPPLAGNESNHGEIVKYGENPNLGSKNAGFQTVFRSLFCPPSAIPETKAFKDDLSTGDAKKEVFFPGKESNHGEIDTYDKNHDMGSKNTGFQSMFRSLFCSSPVMPETRILKNDPSTRESKEFIFADKMIIEASPISCHRESSGSDEQVFMSGDKVNTFALAHGEGTSKLPIKSLNVGSKWEACKSTSTDKKSAGNSSSRKTIEGGSSSGSQHILRSRNEKSSSSSRPSESKAIKDLWITRFCVRDHHAALNLDEQKQRDETAGYSPDCTRSNPNARVSSESLALIDQKGLEAREYSTYTGNVMFKNMQPYAFNADASTGSMEVHAYNNEKLPSPKFKSSEAMTSLFPRRLDAMKHFVPSAAKNEATCSRTTCFFCGRRGHDLRNCSEVSETELESLLKNIASYDGTEGFHSLCIRCLQLDHWAIACPVESSDEQQQQEHGNSFLNHCCARNLQTCTGDEKYPNIIANHIASGNDTDDLITNGNLILFGRMVGSSNVKENMAPDLVENVLNGNDILPSPTFGSNESGGIPKGAFDAIRKISLSRGTILKWIDSKSSLLHLDGFFLRLRIGKQEAELGGTGYYVARIAGTQKENPTTASKKFIPVSVGSIKCFVGCQYVSNHDFLEDELLAWWCKTSESGGSIPSEDELRLKLEERMKLGF